MAERWQTAEARVAAVFFRDASGVPVTGLTPTATVVHKDGSGSAPTGTVAEVANGFYRVTLSAAPTKDVLVCVDGGASLSTTRYVALEVPVGGYVDNLDAAVSSRATSAALTTLQAAVTALGSPAQASALASLVTTVGTPAQASALSALATACGSPAQASALTAAVVTLLAEIDTRATPDDLAVTVTAPLTAHAEIS